MVSEYDKLCRIAIEWEQDRSFERDDEFFDQELIRDEPSKRFVQNSKKRRKCQRANAKQRSDANTEKIHHVGAGQLPSPASTIQSHDTALAHFIQSTDGFAPFYPQSPMQCVRFGDRVDTGIDRVRQHMTGPWSPSMAMASYDPTMACWHQIPPEGDLVRCPPLTPFQAIMKEAFRGQAAREMAMMADLAREQAEYWWMVSRPDVVYAWQ